MGFKLTLKYDSIVISFLCVFNLSCIFGIRLSVFQLGFQRIAKTHNYFVFAIRIKTKTPLGKIAPYLVTELSR